MNYSPHILYVQQKEELRDEFNRVKTVYDDWIEVGPCRCDDNVDKIVSTENSLEYVPKYHIVCNRTNLVRNGDKVRVLYPDGTVRGEGKADGVRVLNYLDYAHFYA